MHRTLGSCSVAVTLAFVVSGCGSSEKDEAVSRFDVARNICDVERTVPNSITSVQTISGSIIHGNAVNKATFELPTLWISAYATRADKLVKDTSGPGFCCNWYGGFFYCGTQYCESEEVTDISYLYGVGRASTKSEATRLARQNCDSIVENFIESNNDADWYDSEFDCERLVVQRCN